MEAPEKIYVNFPFGERHPERGPMVTKQGLNAEDIEYTRTDTFIEKALEFLSKENNIPLWEDRTGNFGCDTPKLVDKFKNYMKGE